MQCALNYPSKTIQVAKPGFELSDGLQNPGVELLPITAVHCCPPEEMKMEPREEISIHCTTLSIALPPYSRMSSPTQYYLTT